MRNRFLLAVIGCLWLSSAWGEPSVRAVALFPGKAMLLIDGERRFLGAGQTSPEGVRLVSATTSQVVVEIDGKRRELGLSRVVGGSFKADSRLEARITRNPRGGFETPGMINGRQTRFLVDTGADVVAMSEAQAKEIGVRYRLRGTRLAVATASGRAKGYGIVLDRVRVGDIELKQVEAIVIEGESHAPVLLGMSFLKRVEMRNNGAILVLRTRPR